MTTIQYRVWVVSGAFVLQAKLLCLLVSSKVHMELVWPAGKVGPSGGQWVDTRVSGQPSRGAGMQGPPSPFPTVLMSPEGLHVGPEVLRRPRRELAGDCGCVLGAISLWWICQ